MPIITANFENKCPFCHKHEATKLCDKAVGNYRWIGHPLRSVYGYPGSMYYGGKTTVIITCDRIMCDKCATRIDGMDICPCCLGKIKNHLGGKP